MDQMSDGPQDRHGVAPTELHVVTWGPPTRHRAVVLVHGLTASHREFVQLGPALAARGWYVLAPDLRGRGLSSKPPHGYGIALHANDLLTICDTLGLDSIHVVGHSLGAAIGLYTAALSPGRVGKLVMVDAGGKVPEDTAQAIAASVSRLGTVYPSLDAYLAAMSQLPMITWGPFWEQYFRYEAEVHADSTVTSRVPRAAIEEESAALWATRTEELPPLVRAPTLVLRAALGTLGPDRGIVLPAEEAERLRTVMSDCRVEVIPDVNHYTIVLAPGFAETIATFLETAVEEEAMRA
jgi:pimeloyl-ACP methyl ester carboxylesterase